MSKCLQFKSVICCCCIVLLTGCVVCISVFISSAGGRLIVLGVAVKVWTRHYGKGVEG